MRAPYRCPWCGAPAWREDIPRPPAYCHEGDHGSQEEWEAPDELYEYILDDMARGRPLVPSEEQMLTGAGTLDKIFHVPEAWAHPYGATSTSTTSAPAGSTVTSLLQQMEAVALPQNPEKLSGHISGLAGMRVVESRDCPRYTLPEEVIPGVPWPPGFREEFNRWSTAFLGTTNIVPKGMAYVLMNDTLVMRPEDVVKLSNLST